MNRITTMAATVLTSATIIASPSMIAQAAHHHHRVAALSATPMATTANNRLDWAEFNTDVLSGMRQSEVESDNAVDGTLVNSWFDASGVKHKRIAYPDTDVNSSIVQYVQNQFDGTFRVERRFWATDGQSAYVVPFN